MPSLPTLTLPTSDMPTPPSPSISYTFKSSYNNSLHASTILVSAMDSETLGSCIAYAISILKSPSLIILATPSTSTISLSTSILRSAFPFTIIKHVHLRLESEVKVRLAVSEILGMTGRDGIDGIISHPSPVSSSTSNTLTPPPSPPYTPSAWESHSPALRQSTVHSNFNTFINLLKLQTGKEKEYLTLGTVKSGHRRISSHDSMNSNGRVAELDMDMGPGLGVPLYSLLTFFKGPRSPRGVQGQQSERSSRRAVYA